VGRSPSYLIAIFLGFCVPVFVQSIPPTAPRSGASAGPPWISDGDLYPRGTLKKLKRLEKLSKRLRGQIE